VRKGNERRQQFPSWLVNGLAVFVLALWGISFIADIISTEYEPPLAIHGAAMLILGAIFGVQVVRRNKNS
jgi:hypothetical protein